MTKSIRTKSSKHFNRFFLRGQIHQNWPKRNEPTEGNVQRFRKVGRHHKEHTPTRNGIQRLQC